MKNQEIKDLCEPMLGKLVDYNRTSQMFESYRIATEKVNICLTNEIIPVPFDHLEDFLKDISKKATDVSLEDTKHIPENLAPIKINSLIESSVIKCSAKELADIIKQNIQSVRENAAFIPQAEAINNQIKTFIDLAKTEVEMVKTAHLISR